MDFGYFVGILKEELVPALGCTEPISLAYAGAVCRKLLGEIPEYTDVSCSGNIIKNVKGVVVPNCGGMKGIDTAIAAGMLAGDASKGLEVLSSVTANDLPNIKEYLERGNIRVNLLETDANLHFIVEMKTSEHSALVEIKNEHTCIVREEKDGKSISLGHSENRMSSNRNTSDRSLLSVESIIRFASQVDTSLLEPIIGPQIENNMQICQEGLENTWGAEVGRTVLEDRTAGALSRAEALAAAGSDARMSGCSMPVVINSGSGNQGITVSIPVIEYAREHNINHEQLLRALAISNLLAIHQKTHIGRLSAYCGAVCAACGAGAAITWLSGGSTAQVEETITNTLATISGMVCDGAKPSCAGKIAVAINAAFIAHKMAMVGRGYRAGEGIVKDDVEKTVSSIGQVASQGMKSTDQVILNVMLQD